jgi:uncharacterized protein YjbI with pentapeptide repeats
MNRDEAIKLLKGGREGIAEWNRRCESRETLPSLDELDVFWATLIRANLIRADLRAADLRGTYLRGADLNWADLSKADLSQADLTGANLHHADLSQADLTSANLSQAFLHWANLSEANLSGADLSVANLAQAELRHANLRHANLRHANLSHANLSQVNLTGTNLSHATLREANLGQADLSQADLSGVICNMTLFVYVDLSGAIGLDSIRHLGPSSVGIDTLVLSKGKISEEFLRTCGVPESVIANRFALIGAMEPIQFYSCFISHASVDNDFARRLFSRMRDERIRVWFDEEDMKAGRQLHPQIDEAIRIHDKFLLILSEASMQSTWVGTEIRRTRLAEKREGKRKLFPIRLVDFKQIEAWELPDDSGEDLAVVVRRYFIPDFSNWKHDDLFEAAFARLLRDLKAEESTGASDEEPTPPETPR